MLNEMRQLAWRKESAARAIKRLTGLPNFETAVRSASLESLREAYKLIANSDSDRLQDWVKAHTRDFTTEDLKNMAYHLGIPRYSRMNNAQLRKAVEAATSVRNVRHSQTCTSGIGFQNRGNNLQPKET